MSVCADQKRVFGDLQLQTVRGDTVLLYQLREDGLDIEIVKVFLRNIYGQREPALFRVAPVFEL